MTFGGCTLQPNGDYFNVREIERNLSLSNIYTSAACSAYTYQNHQNTDFMIFKKNYFPKYNYNSILFGREPLLYNIHLHQARKKLKFLGGLVLPSQIN